MRKFETFSKEVHRIVSEVRKNFPFYDEIVRKSGYDIDNQPALLPFLNETILTDHYYSTKFPHLSNDRVYFTSGTSTGKRKRILYSSEDHEEYVKHRRCIFERFLTPECKVVCSDLGTGHAASSAMEIFTSLGLECHYIDFHLPASNHVKLLNRYRPDVLFTMPMILDSILLTGHLRIQPKKILLVGDVASVVWKNHIVKHFGIERKDLTDLYGSIEVGSIAYECSRCGLYHFDDHIIAEAIHPSDVYPDKTTNDVERLVVLTSLARKYFPSIRFIPNDLIVGFCDYTCNGKQYFSFEKIVGRLGTDIKHGESLSMYDISSAVNEVLPGARFDVFKDHKRLLIRIVSHNYSEESAESIRRIIYKLNPDIDQMIRSKLVADIEIEQTLLSELRSSTKLSFR